VSIHKFASKLSSGYISGNLRRELPKMSHARSKKSHARRKTLSSYRRRLKRRGVVRLEVHVRKDDAPLVRSVVKALGDPDREADARALLRERFGATKPTGFKALLASAPLAGIDLTRERDFGRDVEL
jgi:hypothetical protein